MKKIIIILCLLSFDTLASSNCLEVIKADRADEIIESCFRAKSVGQTLQQAILYEELENDFGSFFQPTEAFKLLKLKAKTGSPKVKYILAQSIKLAYKMSMPKFLGRDDLVTDSRDLTDENVERFESYSKKVEGEYNEWLLLSGNGGYREAMLMYVKSRLSPYKTFPKQEIEKAIEFTEKLIKLGEPGAESVLESLNQSLKK